MANACDRRDRRYALELPAKIVTRSNSVAAVTDNVSYRGAFLRTTAKVAKRELVRVRLTLLDGREIVVHGMAAYIIDPNDGDGRPQGIGLQFYGLDGEPRAQWERMIASLRDSLTNEVSQVVALPRGASQSTRPELPVRVATASALERFIAQDLARMIFIRTTEALAVGTEVTLQLLHPDHGGTFGLECVVRRRMFGTHAGVGVELLFVNEEIRNALATFVRPAFGNDLDVEWAEEPAASVPHFRARARSA